MEHILDSNWANFCTRNCKKKQSKTTYTQTHTLKIMKKKKRKNKNSIHHMDEWRTQKEKRTKERKSSKSSILCCCKRFIKLTVTLSSHHSSRINVFDISECRNSNSFPILNADDSDEYELFVIREVFLLSFLFFCFAVAKIVLKGNCTPFFQFPMNNLSFSIISFLPFLILTRPISELNVFTFFLTRSIVEYCKTKKSFAYGFMLLTVITKH